MDLLLEGLDYKVDTVSFSVSFDKKLNKKEQNFLIFLLDRFEKEDYPKTLTITFDDLKSSLGLKSTEESVNLFNKFILKYINYSFNDISNDTSIIGGLFPIITSIKYNNESINIVLSKEIIDSYNNISVFNKVHLNTLIKFKVPSSVKLYQELIKYIDIYSSFEMSLDKIKDLFEMSDSYGRFYDFEKNILKLAITEINQFSSYFIDYEKIKSGDGKTNRIISLKFFFHNKKVEKLQKYSNELMNMIKERINNFDKILHNINYYLEKFDYKYVKDNIIFALEHFEGDFDDYLLNALKDNYVITHFELKTKEADEKYNLLIDVAAHFSNIFKLESELYKQLSKLKFHYDFEFVSVLHQLKTKNKLEFSNENIKVFVEFNKSGDSYIKIYSKTDTSSQLVSFT